MKEPKHILYECAGNPREAEVKEDLEGNLELPAAGSIIVHNGCWWNVLDVIEAAKVDRMIVYRVILKRWPGHDRDRYEQLGHGDPF